ncbi:hypothetical protein HDU67_000419 [Dinochytrium kinnereticum]|nr:hypothetical protein HDU67_000419 [Dinochytrium kinnereticum]
MFALVQSVNTPIFSTRGGNKAGSTADLKAVVFKEPFPLLTEEPEPWHVTVDVTDEALNPMATPNASFDFFRSSYASVDTAKNSRILINALTSFLDGSGLYGHTEETAASMRSFKDGLLKSQNYSTGEFPVKASDGLFAFPNVEVNISPQILAGYVVFLREHNRKARQIKAVHPTWSDEEIYQKARKWLIAILQKITYYQVGITIARQEFNFQTQYLPVLLGEAMPAYAGYKEAINPQIDLFFSNVAFRYGHSAINQLVMRFEENGQVSDAGHMLVRGCIFDPNIREFQTHGIESVLRGMALQREQAVDVSVVDDMRDFFAMSGRMNDMPATDVQRGRDVGLPDYNTCREDLGLPRHFAWSEITADIDVQARLRELYNNNISNVDPIVGAMAEDHTGSALVGPLFAVSIKDQFLRIRDGDRFWFENPGVLDEDEKRDLSQIFLGELIKQNTKIIKYPTNPFRTSVFSASQSGLDGTAPLTPTSTNTVFSSIEIFGALRLRWDLRSSEGVINFVFESNSSGWFAFGIGSNMVNADIYFAAKNSSGVLGVTDSWSFSPGIPAADTSSDGRSNVFDVKDVTSSHNSKQAVSFSRKLITGDSRDTDIINGITDMIFAFHPSSHEMRYHEGNRGSVKVNLYMQGIFVARYYTDMNKWVEIHATLMTTVTSNVLITAITAIIGKFGEVDMTHVRLGLSVVGLVVTTTATGYLSSKVSWKFIQPYLSYIRSSHRVLGFVTYFLGIVTGYYGSVDIQYGDESRVWIQWAYVGLIGVMPVFLVIYGEYHKFESSKNLEMEGGTLGRGQAEKLPLFHWEDVNQRVSLGAKWIIIDNTIYDIEGFIDKHPGGPSVLRNTVGLDVTKLFFGSNRRTLDRLKITTKAAREADQVGAIALIHKHSRFAKYLLSGMAVGRLRKDDEDDVSTNRDFLSSRNSSKSKTNTLQRHAHIIGSGAMSPKEMEELANVSLSRWKRPAITPDHFQNYQLAFKTLLTPAGAKFPVYHFRFEFSKPDDRLKVKPGQSVLFQFVDEDGKVITRSYTPIRHGPRDPHTNKPLCKIYLLIVNHSELDVFAAAAVDELEKAADGALMVNYLVTTQSLGANENYIVGKLSQEVISATMPKPPWEHKVSSWIPSSTVAPVPSHINTIMAHRRSYTLSPPLDKNVALGSLDIIVEAGESGSRSGELFNVTNKPYQHRTPTRDDAVVNFQRHQARDSVGAHNLSSSGARDDSMRRRSIEDKTILGRSRTITAGSHDGQRIGYGASDGRLHSLSHQPEFDLDMEMFQNMLIVVCGLTSTLWTPSAVILGMYLAQDGVLRAIRSAKSRRPLVMALGYIAITSLALLGVGHGITWPLRLLRRLVGGKNALWVLDWAVSVADSVMFWFLVMMPNAGLYFFRYIYPNPVDLVFFESLKTFTGEIALPGSRARFCLRFARSLETIPSGRVAYYARVISYLRRYSKRLAILGCVWIVSKVPGFGGMAWPLATFLYLSFHIGWKPSLWICGLGLVSPPWGRFVQRRLLRNLLAFRALGRELMEPYICRSKMDMFQKRAWFFKHEPVLAGFTIPFYLLLEIPILGPALFFGLSQASAARVCLELFDETDVAEGGPREIRRQAGGGEGPDNRSAATTMLPTDSVAKKLADLLDLGYQ